MQLAHHTRPPCPVAEALVATWEGGLTENERRRIVAPLRARLGSTRTAAGSAVGKAAVACDWLVRTAAPVWLEITSADPKALAALRACPSLLVDPDDRKARIAVDRAIQAVLAARMLACNTAWSRSRPPRPELEEEANRIAEQLLPLGTNAVFGRTGFGATLAAADRAPYTNRWPTLRDHLSGLAHAAAATITWQAVWAALPSREAGTWTMTAQRRLDREAAVLTMQIQPQALALANRIFAP